MLGTLATHTNGFPWPGGESITFKTSDVLAVGSFHSYNTFVKRCLVRLSDGRLAFVKIGEQNDTERKWLGSINRRLNRELRAKALAGTLGVPSKDIDFIVHWTTAWPSRRYTG